MRESAYRIPLSSDSLCKISAIDRHHDAGDEAVVVGGEEHDGSGDFGGFAEAALGCIFSMAARYSAPPGSSGRRDLTKRGDGAAARTLAELFCSLHWFG